MRDLILSWLDERRSYKRRLFNKRLTKISARIELLNILIYLLKEDNIEKTIGIIKNSDSEEVINNLMKLAKMSSFQATRIADMRLSAFTKDARKRYKEERDKLEIERKDLMTLIRSEKRIDKIICDELEDLRKYARPRRSNIVSASTEKHIANTTHNIVVSKDGYLKKLAYYEDAPNKNSNMGAFKSGDYPIHHLIAHNTTSIVLFDTFGRYSILPVHEIDTTEPSQYGHQIFDITKLSGRIVKCFEAYDNDLIKVMKKKVGEPYLLTITRRGYGKKTPMETYTDMKNTRNIRAMKIRDDDAIAVAEVMFDSSTLIIYTKKGEYSIIKMKDIAEQVKDAMGLITMRVQDDDEVAGVAVIGDTDDYVLVMSEKGMCKRVPIQYFGAPGRRGVLRDQGSMMTLDPTDAIRFVSGMTEDQDLVVGMRSGVTKIPGYSIPNTTKKSKGKKLVFPGSGANIVVASIIDRK
jgi:DNA gyrase subunit A